MPRKNKYVDYHMKKMESCSNTEERAVYLEDLVAQEGLEPLEVFLPVYVKHHDDGLRVFVLFLKREQEFEGDIGELLESLATSL